VKVCVNVVSLLQSDLLKGRTALITGGTSGIGKAIAIAFLNAGANVIITSRTQKKADEVANTLGVMREGQFAKGIELNNEEIDSFENSFGKLIKEIGHHKIDILVNNAGVRGGRWGNTTINEYDKVMDTNLKGVFFLTELVARYMKENGIHGNILNICSASSLRPANSAYSLSKWGMRALTHGLAKTLIPYDIVVNGIAPGPTATPMFGIGTNDNLEASSQPNRRFTTVEEIADMAVVYVSDMARTIVGDIAYMTGGAAVLTYDDNNYDFE
jgi:NAD(P)-dependent dehydrogenase (short-subunit alcohol dehydrogenase family)